MNIYESSEEYLGTILMLKERKGNVRSSDITNEISFEKPSVSHALKQFQEKGYITVDEDSFIHLTVAGRDLAQRICERHKVVAQMLKSLGVTDETAKKDACGIEQNLSEETFARIKEHLCKNGITINEPIKA
ncbi:MAG TPA: metal-dependent transcriptional regulator [Clostridiales bacterium]|nr:metal-dependent transcriptional regulator [Clostridiales bacterium]